jgi:hypothetical protein
MKKAEEDKSLLENTMATSPPPSPDINDVEPDFNSSDPFKFAHGLTGVEQPTNYLVVNVLVFSLCALGLTILLFLLASRIQAERRRVSVLADPTRHLFWSRNRTSWWPLMKKYGIYAPLWRNRHNREFQLSSAISMGTLPTRLDTIVLTIYTLSNIAYCLVLPWHSATSHAQIIAALRGRCGALAVFNLIPTILFALRNNPLIWLLGLSYDTFNLMHRWTARIVIGLSIAHISAFLYNTYNAPVPAAIIQTTGSHWTAVGWVLREASSYRFGLVAAVSFLLLGITAWSPVRHAFYDTFLNAHRLFIVVALTGVYFHLLSHTLPQLPWAQLAVILWILEFVLRIARIVYFNVGITSNSRSGGDSSVYGDADTRQQRKGVLGPLCTSTVEVEALPDEACRLTFTMPPGRIWKARSGSHAHIYLPQFSLWMSHPFSIAWWSQGGEMGETKIEDQGDKTFLKLGMRNSTRLLTPTTACSEISAASSATYLPETLSGSQSPWAEVEMSKGALAKASASISFIIRARAGMTRKLFLAASKSPSQSITTYGAVEGPYPGAVHSLNSYGTVLLFAAGVGITHQLSFAWELLSGAGQGVGVTQRVVILWAVRTEECAVWVRRWFSELAKLPGAADILRVRVYVSRPRHRPQPEPQRFCEDSSTAAGEDQFEDVKLDGEEESADQQHWGLKADVRVGRCDPQVCVDEEFEQRIGAMAVTVCGPGAFADTVRCAVRRRVTDGCIDFIEEAFSY